MKKNRSSNVRRAWPSSELSERPLEHNLSRSEKDIRVQKQHLPPPPAPHFSPSPPSYRAPADLGQRTGSATAQMLQRWIRVLLYNLSAGQMFALREA
ncbi:Storkhead-box protein 2 [Dissostichus eleginoides]|uniref:Storkhead-box protein 2 n=1 Tax=Dissostichus eleginoides TaxID=100907 RepID=A0AAD9F290_DISEL|nr:Storkhead-box protein 2 [Dissostichus eleginoides]